MKKFIAALLTAAMLATCTSCNIGKIANKISDNSADASSAIVSSSDVTEDDDNIFDIEAVKDTLNSDIERGVITDNVYYSDYSGIGFNKPDDWVYYTDEQIADMMDIAQDSMDTDSFQDTANQLISVYDMAVVDNVNGTNVNISYENLALTNSTNITEAEYADAVAKQLESLSSLNQNMVEQTTVTLGNYEYLRTTCDVKYVGVEMTQVYYFRKIDSFMNIIVITIMDNSNIDDIEAMFF